MDQLGYIKDIEGVVERLGGVSVDKLKIMNIANPFNSTFCFVIKPRLNQFVKNNIHMNKMLYIQFLEQAIA